MAKGGANEKRQRASTVNDFFLPRKKKKAPVLLGQPHSTNRKNPQAEEWGRHLQQSPCYLTKNCQSWYIHAKRWMPTPSREAFDQEWALHPTDRHKLQVYGRPVLEKRWSQSWGFSYAYSGATNQARPLTESTVLSDLLKIANLLLAGSTSPPASHGKGEIQPPEAQNGIFAYNGCLQNWYAPMDSISLHADDEKSLCKAYPILSLSWGGTRRFLFRGKRRPKETKGKVNSTTGNPNCDNTGHIHVAELWLEDGDLLVMGGTCQESHKHEVPKVRKTKDPPTANRINWTIRAFR